MISFSGRLHIGFSSKKIFIKIFLKKGVTVHRAGGRLTVLDTVLKGLTRSLLRVSKRACKEKVAYTIISIMPTGRSHHESALLFS